METPKPSKRQAALALRASILRICPHLETDAVQYAKVVKLLLDELQTGCYRTQELCEICGDDIDRGRLRFEFRHVVSEGHREWEIKLASIAQYSARIKIP